MLERFQQCPDGQQTNLAELSLAHNLSFFPEWRISPRRHSNLIRRWSLQFNDAFLSWDKTGCSESLSHWVSHCPLNWLQQMISDDIPCFLYTLLYWGDREAEPCKILPPSWGRKVNSVVAAISDNVWQLTGQWTELDYKWLADSPPLPPPSQPAPQAEHWTETIRETMCCVLQ